MRVGALAGTPLLLTIAAAVYWRRHKLPPRRSELYGQFVDILLEEDERRPEVWAAYGDLLAYRRPIIERIALWCQEELGGGLMPERDFEAQVARILRGEMGLRPFEVEAQARRYVQMVCERGGLLVRRGDALDFVHPTFREHLAACALRRRPRAEVDEIIRTRWDDPVWREVVLFLLCLLSDDRDQNSEVSETSEVSRLVQHILESGEEGLYFAAACLADQVTVDEELNDRVVDGLLCTARLMSWSDFALTDLGFRHNPIAALKGLRTNERAVEGLLALAHYQKVDAWGRLRAAIALSELGRADGLLALAYDEGVDIVVRLQVVGALGELDRADDLLALVRDREVWEWVRLKAVITLGKLSHASPEVLSGLRALADDPQTPKRVYHASRDSLQRLEGRGEALKH